MGQDEKKRGFFTRLREGLSKTRETIAGGLDRVFSGYSQIDEDFYEELEETMIMGDMGIHATDAILENLREEVKRNRIKEPEKCREILIDNIRSQM